MKENKLKNWSLKIGKFLSSNKKILLFLVSLVVAVLVGYFMYCNQLILWFSVASSLVLYLRLPFSNVEISDKLVRLFWAFVNFSLIVATCKLFAFEAVDNGYPNPIYDVGALISLFATLILYVKLIPWLSNKIKLINKDHGYEIDICGKERYTKENGPWLSMIISLILCLTLNIKSVAEKSDYLFEQESFVKVISWDKETINRTTHYIVKTENGIFAISPYEYPEIRNINSNTKIKVLKRGKWNGMDNFIHLEIKN